MFTHGKKMIKTTCSPQFCTSRVLWVELHMEIDRDLAQLLQICPQGERSLVVQGHLAYSHLQPVTVIKRSCTVRSYKMHIILSLHKRSCRIGSYIMSIKKRIPLEDVRHVFRLQTKMGPFLSFANHFILINKLIIVNLFKFFWVKTSPHMFSPADQSLKALKQK